MVGLVLKHCDDVRGMVAVLVVRVRDPCLC